MRVNDCQARIASGLAVQAMRGTMLEPENETVLGATDEQLVTRSTMLYVIRFGWVSRVIHMQSAITGSGVAV